MNNDEQQIILHEWCEMHSVLENLLREYEDLDGSHPGVFQPAARLLAQIKKRTDALESEVVEIQKVKRLQDDDSHWYWVPENEVDTFIENLSQITGIDYMDFPDAFDAFSASFEKYRTGGSPDSAPDIFQDGHIMFLGE